MSRSVIVAAALIALSANAGADVYKCTVGGKSVFSDVPCARDAKRADGGQDTVTVQQQIDRLELSIKERRERNRIESRQDAEYRARQQALANQIAMDETRAKYEESTKRQRCDRLEIEIRSNQAAIARYLEYGWQKMLTQQEQDLRKNRESFDRDCR